MYLAHHLLLVGSTFYFRIRVPPKLRQHYPAKYIKRSLGTGNLSIAKEQAYILSATYKNQFRRLRGMSKKDDEILSIGVLDANGIPRIKPGAEPAAAEIEARNFDLDLLPNGQPYIRKTDPNNPQDFLDAKEALKLAQEASRATGAVKPLPQPSNLPHSVPAASGDVAVKTLEDAIPWYRGKIANKVYTDEEGREIHNVKPETLEREEKFLKEFLKYHGDCAVETIQRYHISNYEAHLKNKVGNETPTRKNKLSVLGKFFDELIDGGFYSRANPARGHVEYTTREKVLRHKLHGKLHFEPADLAKVFNPSTFCDTSSPSRYFSPLLQLYTGCRVNEICQLETRDFLVKDGIQCVHINDEGEDLDRKSTKTKATERIVPVHPNLIAIGLMDYVEAVRKGSYPNGRIFPHLKYGKNRFGGAQIKAFMDRPDFCRQSVAALRVAPFKLYR